MNSLFFSIQSLQADGDHSEQRYERRIKRRVPCSILGLAVFRIFERLYFLSLLVVEL